MQLLGLEGLELAGHKITWGTTATFGYVGYYAMLDQTVATWAFLPILVGMYYLSYAAVQGELWSANNLKDDVTGKPASKSTGWKVWHWVRLSAALSARACIVTG